MATTITALRTPVRITLGGSDVLTQVNLPAAARSFTVQFITNTGKIAWSGTDAGAIGAAFVTLYANQLVEVAIRDGEKRFEDGLAVYLASATAATVVEVMAEE